MTTSNITQQKYTVTVTEGATTLVTVKAVGPQGPQGALQTGDVGDFTVSVANDGTQSAVINTGAVTSSKILDGTIVNADINASASIDGTKISPNFGSQNISTTGTVGGLDLSTYQANGGSYLRSDADDSFTGTLTGTSDMTNPVILIKGGGPNFIRFDSNDGVSADTIDLIYRTTPNTLAFERRSDSQIMFSVDADDQQAIFNGNVDCNSGLDVSGGDITGVLGSAVTGTTQSASDNSTKIATTSYVDTAVSNLVNSAPSTLDTLGEIATALNNDAALNTTLTNSIATKLPLAGGTLTGDLTISTTAPLIKFDETDQTTDYFIVANNNTLTLTRNNLNSPNHIQKWNSDGHVDFLTNVDFASGIDVTGEITGTSHIDLPDDAFLKLGDSDEFQIYHRGNDGVSLINEQGGGYLSFGSNGSRIEMYDIANARVMAKFNVGGSCEFKHAADIRLETSSTGISVTGDINGTGNLIITADTPKIQLIDNNADDDFQISNFSGNFIIKDITNSVDRFTIASDGTTTVANNLNVGAGIDVTGSITIPDATITNGIPNNAIKIGDATDGDLMIYHDSNNSVIRDAGTGSLIFQSNQIVGYRYGTSEKLFQFDQGGAASLFYGGASTAKLATSATGVDVNGDLSVTSATNNQLTLTSTTRHSTIRMFDNAGSSFIQNRDGNVRFIVGGNTSGSNATDVLYLDGANNRVGIGSNWQASNPAYQLDLTGTQRNTVSAADTEILILNANMGTNNNRAFLVKAPETDSGSQPFRIQTGNALEVQIDGNKTLNINSSGQINLHHAGSSTAKLSTSATGVNVEGTATISNIGNNQGLNLDGANNNTCLHFTSTGSSPAHGFRIAFHSPTNSRFGSPALLFDKINNSTRAFDSHIAGISDDGFHLDDNKKIHLGSQGATGDLQIYHNALNSWIVDQGTGHLIIGSNGDRVRITKGVGAESIAEFITDGAVELYFDGGTHSTPKLETTATGVDINGELDIASAGGLTSSPSLYVNNSSSRSFIHTGQFITPSISSGQQNIVVIGQARDNLKAAFIGYKYSGSASVDNLLTFNHWSANELVTINGQGNVVATGDGTFDDIRVGEHAGNNDFGGIFHKDQSGSEYMMISKDEHTFISASTGHAVSIVGGNNVFTNNIQVHPTNGVNITAANNVNIVDGNLSFVSNSDTYPSIVMKGNNQRVKFSVWDGIDTNTNIPVYGIGMQNSISYGSIGNATAGNNQFAMTFQMNNTNDRGWVFLDSSHSNAQGAMSLTTQGRMTVAHSMRLGYGESDTTESGATHALDVSGSISSTSTISATTSNASTSTDLRKITTSTSQPSGGADGDIWIVVPS